MEKKKEIKVGSLVIHDAAWPIGQLGIVIAPVIEPDAAYAIDAGWDVYWFDIKEVVFLYEHELELVL